VVLYASDGAAKRYLGDSLNVFHAKGPATVKECLDMGEPSVHVIGHPYQFSQAFHLLVDEMSTSIMPGVENRNTRNCARQCRLVSATGM